MRDARRVAAISAGVLIVVAAAVIVFGLVVAPERHEAQGVTTASASGPDIYAGRCSACHGPSGGGASGPSFIDNPRVADAEFVVGRILHGSGRMPAWASVLDDRAVAEVASHIRTSWGNDGSSVGADLVARLRQQGE